jgi:hypothetical protein
MKKSSGIKISDEADLFCVCVHISEKKKRKDSIVFYMLFPSETGQDIARSVCDVHAGGLMAI